MYDYIVRAIVNTFPHDVVSILEKCAEDLFGEFDITEKASSSLFKFICSFYLSSPSYVFTDSIVSDYGSNNDYIYDTKSESLSETIRTKKVSFTKEHDEVIRYFDDYLESKNQLTVDNFSKELLDSLISKNKAISDFTIDSSNSINEMPHMA